MKNNNIDMLLTNTLSTPMVYYISYEDTIEDISHRYKEIKPGESSDMYKFFFAKYNVVRNPR